MPLVFLTPLLAGSVGFGVGWWAGDSFGWVKWLLFAVLALYVVNKMGVI
jgi:hypothetical protein